MPSIYDLKPAFQNTLKPLMSLLTRCSITPNQVTVAALLLSGLGGGLIWIGRENPLILLVIPALLLVRMALNALDGMMARTFGQSTPFGEILNEVGDVVSDTALYLPLMVLFYDSMLTVLAIAVFVTLACLTEFCGILAKAMIGVRRYDGPMGKSDRAFCMGILCLGLYFFPEAMRAYSGLLFCLLNGLLLMSCLNRLRFILRVLAEANVTRSQS